jgi:hypothetical protein
MGPSVNKMYPKYIFNEVSNWRVGVFGSEAPTLSAIHFSSDCFEVPDIIETLERIYCKPLK